MRPAPYQVRQFGASLDETRQYRARRQILDRGRWVTQSSFQRYEKHARLAASLTRLTPEWRTYFEEAAERLEALF